MSCLSVIIPVLDEAAQIEAVLRATRAALPAAELIVVDGGSQDGTAELAGRLACVVRAGRGRARQMNAGAAQARGDILLFLHADTRLPAGAEATLRAALDDARVAAGAFAMRFDARGPLYAAMAHGNNLRSRLRRIATGDQAIFVRRTAFQAIGGYANIPLMEDLEIWRRLRPHGAFRLLHPPVLVSARRHRAYGPLRVLVSGWCFQILYALGMPPFALHRLYYGKPAE
jgi:rSAM/selenodomain-associated transferase 2